MLKITEMTLSELVIFILDGTPQAHECLLEK